MNTNPHPDALRSRWTIEGRIPLSGVADGAVWHRARSITTGENVVLFVVRGEAALEAADAVRRAYLVEDPHLLPVRDIVVLDDPRESEDARSGTGSANGPTTVVEYALPPAPPLAALLAKGPLHPETARAIIGEAATGLEVARRRGVRHQFLDSNRVFVDTASGAVVLLGVGVEAASHPGLDRSRETASFQDTAALVALLYRALTGRSPRPGSDGAVPRPSTVANTAIPEDLDLLCDLVLNESAEEIPETTRGLIEALQPWQSIPVTLEAYSRSDSRTDSRAASRTTETAPAQETTAAMAAATAGSAPASTTEGETEDPSEDELESTALMAAVPGEQEEPAAEPEAEHLPDEDTVARAPGPAQDVDEDTIARAPSSRPAETAEPTEAAGPAEAAPASAPAASAGSSAAVAGAAGAVGAAAVVGSAAGRDAQDDRTRENPAVAPTGATGSAAPAHAADPEAPGADAPEADAAEASASAQTSSEAKALVQDLHLDQKRGTSPFPGHLDITAPPEPAQPEPAQPDSAAPASAQPTTEEPSSRSGAPAAGAAIAGAAAAGTVGAVGAASSPAQSAPTTGIPSRTSGTHWPLGGSGKEAPLAPAPSADADAAPPQAPAPSPATAAVTPDASAPTPSQPVVHGTGAAAAGPVTVGGRSTPVAPARTDGPIVIHGRDRSLLEDAPDESTVPFERSSLLRDVVGVAVANDAPETYTMGPRDREKRSLQSQWIIIGGALAVMIALVIALTTVTSGLSDILEDPLATSPVQTSAPAEEETTGEAPAEPTAEETEPALPAPELDSVELLALPAGEEPDHTDQVERLTDGDTSTYWSTQHYASPDFGGLKEGVGMRLHFAEKSTFSAVTISTAKNNGGTVELRAVNEDGTPGDVLASGEFVADGEVRLEAPEALDAEQVMLWIPDLPPDSSQNGRFRARVAEIQVE